MYYIVSFTRKARHDDNHSGLSDAPAESWFFL